MLGDTTIKNHVKNSQTLDIKPRVFIEINHNDNNNAYFCGTGTQNATALQDILLTLSNISGTPQVVDAGTSQNYSGRGVETALTTPNNHAVLLKTSQNSICF
jgi:hypothetical protein